MEKPRKLKSGRYQVRITHPFTGERVSDGTRPTLKEAQKAQHELLAKIEGGNDVTGGKVKFEVYALTLIQSMEGTKAVGTVKNYRLYLKNQLAYFNGKALRDITAGMVRAWRNTLADTPSRRNAYVLLGQIMNQAVADGEIPKSPVHIKGGATHKPTKRPSFSLGDVQMLRDIAGPTSLMGVLLYFLAGSGARIGEAVALNWNDINLETGDVHIHKHTLRAGEVVEGTKSQADGERHITLPPPVREALKAFKGDAEYDAPVFQKNGQPLTYDAALLQFTKLKKAGALDDFRLHEIRHIHLTEFARTGSTLAETMARGGHRDPRSAMAYQQATLERDAEIAKKMSEKF